MYESMASLKEEFREFFNDCYFMTLILKYEEGKGSSEVYVS